MKLNDIYHELEVVRLNASQGYKVTKYIQELVKERREIKSELSALDSIMGMFNDPKNSVHHHVQNVYIKQKNKIKQKGVLSGII